MSVIQKNGFLQHWLQELLSINLSKNPGAEKREWNVGKKVSQYSSPFEVDNFRKTLFTVPQDQVPMLYNSVIQCYTT